jgi:Ankyrin repeats (many copies)
MEYTATTMTAAAHSFQLAEVQYLHSQGCAWPWKLLDFAASSGYLELLRWCYEHGCPWKASSAAYYAAYSGNVELMAWVLQQPGTMLASMSCSLLLRLAM